MANCSLLSLLDLLKLKKCQSAMLITDTLGRIANSADEKI